MWEAYETLPHVIKVLIDELGALAEAGGGLCGDTAEVGILGREVVKVDDCWWSGERNRVRFGGVHLVLKVGVP